MRCNVPAAKAVPAAPHPPVGPKPAAGAPQRYPACQGSVKHAAARPPPFTVLLAELLAAEQSGSSSVRREEKEGRRQLRTRESDSWWISRRRDRLLAYQRSAPALPALQRTGTERVADDETAAREVALEAEAASRGALVMSLRYRRDEGRRRADDEAAARAAAVRVTAGTCRAEVDGREAVKRQERAARAGASERICTAHRRDLPWAVRDEESRERRVLRELWLQSAKELWIRCIATRDRDGVPVPPGRDTVSVAECIPSRVIQIFALQPTPPTGALSVHQSPAPPPRPPKYSDEDERARARKMAAEEARQRRKGAAAAVIQRSVRKGNSRAAAALRRRERDDAEQLTAQSERATAPWRMLFPPSASGTDRSAAGLRLQADWQRRQRLQASAELLQKHHDTASAVIMAAAEDVAQLLGVWGVIRLAGVEGAETADRALLVQRQECAIRSLRDGGSFIRTMLGSGVLPGRCNSPFLGHVVKMPDGLHSTTSRLGAALHLQRAGRGHQTRSELQQLKRALDADAFESAAAGASPALHLLVGVAGALDVQTPCLQEVLGTAMNASAISLELVFSAAFADGSELPALREVRMARVGRALRRGMGAVVRSAMLVQRAARRFLALLTTARQRARCAALEEGEYEREAQKWGAITIQRVYRGHRSRRFVRGRRGQPGAAGQLVVREAPAAAVPMNGIRVDYDAMLADQKDDLLSRDMSYATYRGAELARRESQGGPMLLVRRVLPAMAVLVDLAAESAEHVPCISYMARAAVEELMIAEDEYDVPVHAPARPVRPETAPVSSSRPPAGSVRVASARTHKHRGVMRDADYERLALASKERAGRTVLGELQHRFHRLLSSENVRSLVGAAELRERHAVWSEETSARARVMAVAPHRRRPTGNAARIRSITLIGTFPYAVPAWAEEKAAAERTPVPEIVEIIIAVPEATRSDQLLCTVVDGGHTLQLSLPSHSAEVFYAAELPWPVDADGSVASWSASRHALTFRSAVTFDEAHQPAAGDAQIRE